MKRVVVQELVVFGVGFTQFVLLVDLLLAPFQVCVSATCVQNWWPGALATAVVSVCAAFATGCGLEPWQFESWQLLGFRRSCFEKDALHHLQLSTACSVTNHPWQCPRIQWRCKQQRAKNQESNIGPCWQHLASITCNWLPASALSESLMSAPKKKWSGGVPNREAVNPSPELLQTRPIRSDIPKENLL